jgi:predicted nucleic acid-binding protein
MSYLIDTGVLLRVADRQDQQHAAVFGAIQTLIARKDQLLITSQNLAEFCSVATRPAANNGLGLTPDDALQLFAQEVEPICTALAEPAPVYDELKRLVSKYAVTGKQVHDARLVAMMLVWKVENILTLNERNFRRFEPEGIAIVAPSSLISSP